MKRAVLLAALFAGVVLAQTGARYLIITADLHESAIRPLAEWKQARGLLTRVEKLSTIGTDTTSIKNYIRTAYSTWNPRPEFILLVGSANLNAGAAGALPAGRYRYGTQHGYYVYSDDRYGDVNDDGLVELPVGRFPAKSAAQAELMVAKTLAYTRNPDLSDSAWTRRLTLVIRDLQDDDAPTYWSDARNAATLAGSSGFLSCDSLASARGHNYSHVVTSINNGTGLVLYRGSATSNWYTPFAVNPASTDNDKQLPIILSFTCETMTLAPGESMVGQAWLKAGSTAAMKGAVGFIGTTYAGTNIARFRSAGANGFFTGLFAERRYKLGQAFVRAKQNIYTLYPTYTQHYHELNLLGDPELDVWTDLPRQVEVTHPQTIAPEPQDVLVTVERDGVPLQDAQVCLSMDSTVYVTGTTNMQGQVVLAVAPTHTGIVRIVVSGHDIFPYDGSIPVQLSAVSEVTRPTAMARGLLAVPSTFTGSVRISWTSPLTLAADFRVVDATGRAIVDRPIGAGSQNLTWDGRDNHGKACAAGVYRCLLVDKSGSTIGTVRIVKAR